MDSNKYSNYSLQELYDLYTKLNQENNTEESKLVYEQITVKEKLEKNVTNLASLSDRFAAALVDIVVVGLPILLSIVLIYGFNDFLDLSIKYGITFTFIMLLIGQALYFSINGWLLYKYGQTVGKKYLEIKIVNMNNNLPNIHISYTMRYFVPALIGFIPLIGNLFSLLDILFIFKKDRRCIHDYIAGTQVINVA